MDYVLIIVARWLHIMSAALALGVPIYMRFVLLPALQGVDETTRTSVQEGLVRRWRIWVHVLIVVLLATGFYNYLVVARWRVSPEEVRGRYHMFLGIKIMIALAMFFIASALAGRTAALASIRANARTWLNVLIVLGLALVALSNVVRFLP